MICLFPHGTLPCLLPGDPQTLSSHRLYELHPVTNHKDQAKTAAYQHHSPKVYNIYIHISCIHTANNNRISCVAIKVTVLDKPRPLVPLDSYIIPKFMLNSCIPSKKSILELQIGYRYVTKIHIAVCGIIRAS